MMMMMKYTTVAKIIAVLRLSLSSQAIIGVEAQNSPPPPPICYNCGVTTAGTIVPSTDNSTDNRKLLEEDASGVTGHVVLGNDDGSGIFVATNATNFPQGITNGTLSVAISDAEDCNSDTYGRALEIQLEDPVTYEINELGIIEGDRGWFKQSIRELQGNSTLPISLAEIVNGGGLEDGLAVYILTSDKELLGCASIKKLDDEDKAVEYNELLFGSGQDREAVKKAPSSGSKIGLLVSTIAAVGIIALLGDLLAL